MTNEQVTNLLKDCQKFWFKHRDHPPALHGERDQWHQLVNDEALRIIEAYGDTDHVFRLVSFFVEELHLRAEERDT